MTGYPLAGPYVAYPSVRPEGRMSVCESSSAVAVAGEGCEAEVRGVAVADTGADSALLVGAGASRDGAGAFTAVLVLAARFAMLTLRNAGDTSKERAKRRVNGRALALPSRSAVDDMASSSVGVVRMQVSRLSSW